MTIHITDVDGGIGNLILMSGIITDSEFVEVMQKHLAQDPDKYKRYRFSLTDLSDVTELNVSTDVIREHSNACIRSAEVNPDAVVAVVAPEDIDFGLSRMWELQSDDIPWEIRVFRDSEEAKTWIRERVKERWNITDLTMGSTGRP